MGRLHRQFKTKTECKWVGGAQVRLARGKQKRKSGDLEPTPIPAPIPAVRKTFSTSFVPQPAENNTYTVGAKGL